MLLHDHSRDMPSGYHAMFGGSNKAWVHKSPEQILEAADRAWTTTIGTYLHEFAAGRIEAAQKIKSKTECKTLILNELLVEVPMRANIRIPRCFIHEDNYIPTFMKYVNDAVSLGMIPEQGLKYSRWCAGTADAFMFDDVQGLLRIHDLKTGVTPASMEQLRIYTAFFCLEYDIAPGDIDIELRIYQNGEIIFEKPTPAEIVPIMDQAVMITNIMEGL